MLNPESTILVVVDLQEKLAAVIDGKEAVIEGNVRIISGCTILGIPILWTEQNPKGLGPTVPEVRELLTDSLRITKFSFSCCGEGSFVSAIEDLNRRQVLVTGMEAHVCVYQSVADLVGMGYEVQVVADAVSSRTAENKAVGLARCQYVGGSITSVETALFELLKKAEGDKFKEMLKIVK